MPFDPPGAPDTREAVKAALSGPRDAKSYGFRKAIQDWLRDDKDGTKAAWLKGSDADV